jgi:predicted glutamine amidotransferase
MCRLVAYLGAPIYLENLLTLPRDSLINQSRAARESLSTVNADGCGIGWYGDRGRPGVYRSVHPAWSDANLLSLCHQIRSPLFAGHIRAATSGEAAPANCHPFSVDGRLFLHNGEIGGYERLRHAIEMMISEEFYPYRKGTSDSEAIFLNAWGHGLDREPIAAVKASLNDILELGARLDHDEPIYFAAVLIDGETLYAFRWASHHIAPTLYLRTIDTGVVVASEPYDGGHEDWTAVPEDSVLVIGQDRSVDVRPFMRG